ncbi:putative ribosomal RNA small subunit methyltransferase A [groundwater metagenome]|uniref:Putative ribosomal RNA small subunit methyltransferase A n=1 Tax=groundwater metagenome TaxID=717931 RepID=A0A098E6N2_9ZZZZ
MNQNFMIDKNLIKKICDYADLKDNDVVLEIGAGTGNLTAEISKRCGKVIAIERDERLVNFLVKRFKNTNVDIIKGDAVKISFAELKFNKIVSNLPYSISRRITEKILTYEFSIAIIVEQKEFAEKLIVKPKTANYRAVSVIVQASSEVEILESVGRNVFFPVPDVDSVIIKVVQKFPAEENFINFVKDMFNRRNKILKNCEKKFYGKRIYELTPDEIFELWKASEI